MILQVAFQVNFNLIFVKILMEMSGLMYYITITSFFFN